MEPKFQSSFIPKGPIAAASPLAAQYAAPKRSILGLIGTLTFVLTVVASVGIFGYERYLLANIGTMGENLASARASLRPDTIKELVNANQRILGTRQLLARHTALSPFFDYLETTTLKNVRFTDFTYSTTAKGLEVNMKGQARSYSDVAQQSDAFNRSKVFIAPVFSDLDLDSKGNVTFSFHAQLDPAVVSYKKRLEGTPITAPAAAIMATTTPKATTTTTKAATTTAATTTATTTKPKTQ